MTAAHPLFGPLEPELCRDLAAWATAMLERHLRGEPHHLKQALSDLELEYGPLAPLRIHQARPFLQIRLALKGHLQDAPLAAFLAEECQRGGAAAALSADALTAWVLAAALRRRQRSPGQSAIRSGLDAARLLKRAAPELLAELSLTGADMAGVAEQLLALIPREDLPRVIRGYLQRIHYLLRVTLDDKDAIFRQVGERRPSAVSPRDGHKAAEVFPAILSLPGEALGLLRSGSEAGQEAALAGAREEQADDEASGSLWVADRPDKRRFTPRRTAERRLAAVVKAMSRRQLSLSAETDTLTPLEVCLLADFCLQDQSRAARAVFLQLVTGGAFRASAPTGQGLVRDPEGEPFYALNVTLPEPGALIEEEDATEPEPAAQTLWLDLPALPPEVRDVFAAWQETLTISDKEMREALGVLQGKVSRPLSPGRIRRYKADWLRTQGCDPAIVGFLTGELPAYRAQLHYTRLRRAELIWWHRRYLLAHFGSRIRPFPEAPGYYGSQIARPIELFARVMREQQSKLTDCRAEPPNLRPAIITAHNLYTGYTLMLLYLATGHRPVGSPFERLGDMDLDTGLIWISDKSTAGERGARVLVLPQAAQQQLRHWCDHLRRLEAALSFRHLPTMEARIRAALTRDPRAQAPLFFIISEEGRVTELSTATQRELLKRFLRLPLNWSRHLLRSALTSRVDGQLLDAWMGHAHYAELPFKAASGLGIGDLRKVAGEIDLMLEDHGITALESPL